MGKVCLHEIVEFLDNRLRIADFKDYSNNGLQVEASHDISRMAFTVDASLRTFEMAVEEGAELLFVHHGISWREGTRYLTGMTALKYGTLFKNDLSLYAAHLPLDANLEIGNNAVLASFFDLKSVEPAFPYHGEIIGMVGTLKKALPLAKVAAILAEKLNIPTEDVICLQGSNKMCRRLGFVSGRGCSCLEESLQYGCDTFITGECIHESAVLAQDLGISVIAAGHYATETTGPQAVMAEVAKKFPALKCIWIDAPSGL